MGRHVRRQVVSSDEPAAAGHAHERRSVVVAVLVAPQIVPVAELLLALIALELLVLGKVLLDVPAQRLLAGVRLAACHAIEGSVRVDPPLVLGQAALAREELTARFAPVVTERDGIGSGGSALQRIDRGHRSWASPGGRLRW